jgi:hypothetical protein
MEKSIFGSGEIDLDPQSRLEEEDGAFSLLFRAADQPTPNRLRLEDDAINQVARASLDDRS